MAKKKHLSELMRKRDNKVVNENPFEIKINKRRHEVLGQKVMKWERGKPGVSKSKWMKERMETLLAEHHNNNKDNRIKDKPKVITNIPGKATDVVQKFKVARKNLARLYNLDDADDADEEPIPVTHKGRLLTDIEKFEDLEDDSDNEEDEKVFREKFSEVQFGGPANAASGKKDLNQLIFDSIVEKNERNKERRQREMLKESIMKEFEENRPAFNAGLKTAADVKMKEEKPAEGADDLFMKMMMLKGAPRCTPAEQVASPEKNKAKENMMEQERLARMNPHVKATKHRSADDLDDDDCYLRANKKRVRFADVDEEDESGDDDDVRGPKQDDDDDDDDDEEEGEEEEDEEDGEEDDEEEGEEEEEEEEDNNADEEEGDDENEDMEVDEEEDEDGCLATFTQMLNDAEYTSADKLKESIDALYRASRKNPIGCARKLAAAVFEHHLDLQVKVDGSKQKQADLPKDFKLLFLVHYVGNVYSTSDYHHPVVTPVMLLVSQLLTHGAIKKTKDVAYGLLLSQYFLLYVQESKRFVPEVMNFLTSVISLHSSQRKEFYMKNVKNADLLKVSESASQVGSSLRSVTIDSVFSAEAQEFLKSEEFKVSSLSTAIDLMKRCLGMYSRLPAAVAIFRPAYEALKEVDASLYPPCIEEKRQEILKTVETLRHPTSRLIRSENKPVPLPQYTPKLKESKRRKAGEGIKKEELAKYKRLEKGIKREMRKEQNLKNKIKFDEMVHEKHMRTEKTKRILGELANQEGEFKASKKKKKFSDSEKRGKTEKF